MEHNQHYFIFRQPETFDELKALLLLRYRIFHESRLEKFVPANDTGIDLDCYDLCSRHFGLYEYDDGTSRPVGYVRMVTDEPGTFHDDLFEFAKTVPSLYVKVNRIPKGPFPLMNYCPYREEIGEYYQNHKKQGSRLVEAGRLSLDSSIRGVKIATNFVASISAAFLAHGVDETLVTCVHSHQAVYGACGAKPFMDSTPFEVHGAGVCLLLLSANNLPGAMKERVYAMRDAYEQFGRICYDPSNPDNPHSVLRTFVQSRARFIAGSSIRTRETKLDR